MAEKPNQQMDELLRAYASRRRQGAEFPLEPPVRQALRGEVARQFPSPGGRGSPQGWRVWRLRMAFGAGLGAVLLIAVLSLERPSRQETRPTEAAAPALLAAPDAPREPAAPALEAKQEAAAAVLLEAPSAPSGVANPVRDLGAPVRTQARPPDQPARSNERTETSPVRKQIRALSDSVRGGEGPRILVSFQAERTGRQLRLVDEDGSVYTGQIGESGAGGALPQEKEALSLNFSTEGAVVYQFRARGTNRTLGQPVSVEGRYIAPASPVAASEALSFAAGAPAKDGGPSRARAAIFGEAQVGTNKIPVAAVSAEP